MINSTELRPFPNLVVKRGEFFFLEEGESLQNPSCHERWEERRSRGEKPGKGPSYFVLLFGNELWLNPGRRQTVYKEPGITLSLFQASQFRHRAPTTTAPSSQTALSNLCKSSKEERKRKKKKKNLDSSAADSYAKMSVKTVHVKLRKMVLPPEQPDLCLFSPSMAVNAEKRKTK